MTLVKQIYSGGERAPEVVPEEIEGSVVVQGALVFMVGEDEQGPQEPILAYDFATGKWNDNQGKAWDEWEVRPYEDMRSFR